MAEIRVNSTGGVKLYDADDSHYAQIKAGTVTSNTDVLELGSGAVVAGTKVDLNGQELILDADADTSITADTDDQIDVRIAGADDFQFTANTFTAQSGSSIVVPDGGLTFGSTAITSTAAELNILDGVTSTTAELNILDGVTSTAAELNIVDGNTSATSTTIADADRVVLNDNGTMVQAAVTDLKTYIGGAGLTFISKHTASDGDSYLTLDGVFSSTYDNYLLIGTIFLPNTDNNHIRMQLKTSAFSADSIYDSQMLKHSQGSVGNVINQTNEAYGVIGGVGNQGAGSREHSQFQLTMYQPNHGPQHAYWTTLSSGKDYSNHYIAGYGGGVWADDTAVTGIRFYYGSGTIKSGEVAVYGIKPS